MSGIGGMQRLTWVMVVFVIIVVMVVELIVVVFQLHY